MHWQEWGEPAFVRARQEDKPIFLSIGYAACHWCHVMERESFADAATAEFLNRHFVCIKVDREEHPEVDEIYMNAVQLMTGSGGWPLTVFLTPDLKPFYGGTYFPPESRYGKPGFRHLLQQIITIYRQQRERVDQAAQDLSQALESIHVPAEAPQGWRLEQADRAYRAMAATFDAAWGGFGPAPKFPPTGQIALCLRRYHHYDDTEALLMVERTLKKMAMGGIFDHLGGGFHRYSTDPYWLVPHFEKMVYDNALLAEAYLETFLITGEEFYAEVARRTLDWMLQDLADPEGGFRCSWDADSEGEEGVYYLWTPEQVDQVLGPEDGKVFREVYGVTPEGNFRGGSILNLQQDIPEAAARLGFDANELADRLADMRQRMLEARRHRLSPAVDDKVLTDWNGLAIKALARGHRVLGDGRYLQAARRAADFIFERMRREADGGMALLHAWRAGRAAVDGTLDDYAFTLAAEVALYQADFNEIHVQRAEQVAEAMWKRFGDQERGGYWQTSAERRDLFNRVKSARDGAVPSGNSVAAEALAALYHLTGQDRYRAEAEGVLRAFSVWLDKYPLAHLRLAALVDDLTHPAVEVAVVSAADDPEGARMIRVVNQTFLPGGVVAWTAEPHNSGVGLFRGRSIGAGRTAAFVCRDFVCSAPASTAAELKELLSGHLGQE